MGLCGIGIGELLSILNGILKCSIYRQYTHYPSDTKAQRQEKSYLDKSVFFFHIFKILYLYFMKYL
jgi:hypothetical protein